MAIRRTGWVLLPLAVLLAVSAFDQTMRAEESPAKAATKARAKALAKARGKASAKGKKSEPAQAKASPADPRTAAEILGAIREIAEAVERDERSTGSDRLESVVKTLGLPPKTVRKPTLDSAAIDAMIDKTLAASKAPSARLTTDEEFIRRVYLDVAGKLPTPDQVRSFVSSTKPQKRRALIDHLLSTSDYATNWARYWRDVVKFRATVENPRILNFPRFEEWLAEQLKKNRPWDEIATEILTASGNTEEDGAVVFTAAHMAQPNELAGEVSRVFLGVQIQCAECHDHPNDSWKREQFHQFASFFAGVQARPNRTTQPPSLDVITRRGTPRYTMTDLKDPQKTIPVEPKFFLASSTTDLPPRLSAQQRRELAAAYVTSQTNPWFARAFVNRIWYALMGDAFYNPVDDIGPTREANNVEILDALAGQFQDCGYDIKWLFRTILNTRAYQREARSTNSIAGRTPLASNCPSRLRADQIYDALESLGVRLGPPAGMLRGGQGQGQGQGAAALLRRGGPRLLFDFTFGVDPSTPNEDVLGTIPQALFLMNSPQIHSAVQARSGNVLGEILSGTPDNRAALEQLYVRVLSRRPTTKEVEVCGDYLAKVGNRREAFEDIFWSLLNSTEFLSRK